MIKQLPAYKISEEDSVKMSLNEWVWNSHYWIETFPGRYTCQWCGEEWPYNHLGDYNNFCKENIKIKDLLQKRA